jgi:hypothetical protein
MKTTINYQTIEGFYGPEMNGARWLFVKSHKSKKSYPIAKVAGTTIISIEREQALSVATNEEIAKALIAA